MKSIIVLLASLALVQSGCTQSATLANKSKEIAVGGPCEGCEAIHESPVPFALLKSVDTLPDFDQQGPRIEISGVVYKRDGKTPAPGVIIYVYHTDQSGTYPSGANQKGWAARHGSIRGWLKTDTNGSYRFFTLRPAAYPGRTDPAHIHVSIKEPGMTEYWIDAFLFNDDPLLTEAERKRQENRGGNGILELLPRDNGIALGTRHIILGENIPGYPN